jgi:hypothetical protein
VRSLVLSDGTEPEQAQEEPQAAGDHSARRSRAAGAKTLLETPSIARGFLSRVSFMPFSIGMDSLTSWHPECS